MKIGIVTLELFNNYGGILQATALSRVLQSLGHDVTLINRKPSRPLAERVAGHILRAIPGQNIGNIRAVDEVRKRNMPFISARFDHVSKPIRTPEDLERYATARKLDAIIVGSDQVWRADYIGESGLPFFFLALPHYAGLRISYAASFGNSDWPLPERRSDVASWLEVFRAISCREISGTRLLKEQFGVERANVVLDPTLVADRSFYDEAVVPQSDEPPHVLHYVLDNSNAAQGTASAVLEDVETAVRVKRLGLGGDAAAAGVPDWMTAFSTAEFVVTDSYHGTILSILNEKPFVTVGNRARGMDRFESLLEQLGLLDRLVEAGNREALRTAMRRPIDYDRVAVRLRDHRAQSIDFLETALRD